MQQEGFRVTGEHEADHWWFRARRDLFLAQVERAAAQVRDGSRPLALLDFGCGTGFNLSFLSAFGDVTGADRFRDYDRPFRRDHPYPLLDSEGELAAHEQRFDVITALDVLEHLDDDVAGLQGLARLLRSNGQIVLTVPAYDWLWSGEDVISEHRRRYTRRSLQRCCEAAGMRVEYLSYFNLAILPLMTGVIWARRLLGRGTEPRSNLSKPPAWLNRALYALTSREATWVGTESLRLPAGASIVCRLRKRP